MDTRFKFGKWYINSEGAMSRIIYNVETGSESVETLPIGQVYTLPESTEEADDDNELQP